MPMRGGSIRLERSLNLAQTPSEPDLFPLKWTAGLLLAVQRGIFAPLQSLLRCLSTTLEGSDTKKALRMPSPVGKGLIFVFHQGNE